MYFIALIINTIIPIVITIGIIALIVRLRKSKANPKPFTEKDGEIMLKNIYTYLILFVTLMMTIGGSVSVFMGVAEYASPSIYVESYDQYKENRMSTEDPRSDYEQMKQEKKEEAKADAVRHIIQSMGWIIIPLPIFLYFQRQRNRETT